MKIILGSSSPFRKGVLDRAGISFEVVKPEINEKSIRAEKHEQIPLILSFAKAQAVAQKITDEAIIIACDQVIVCNGILLEKPEGEDEVRESYKMYQQYPVHYVNGITVLNTKTGDSITAQEVSVVRFKTIPLEFIEDQIAKGIIFQCAGGIGDETEDHYGMIEQGTKDSLQGLPLRFVQEMMGKIS